MRSTYSYLWCKQVFLFGFNYFEWILDHYAVDIPTGWTAVAEKESDMTCCRSWNIYTCYDHSLNGSYVREFCTAHIRTVEDRRVSSTLVFNRSFITVTQQESANYYHHWKKYALSRSSHGFGVGKNAFWQFAQSLYHWNNYEGVYSIVVERRNISNSRLMYIYVDWHSSHLCTQLKLLMSAEEFFQSK